MSNRVDSRIAALAAAIKKRKLEQATPIDGLSRSMLDFCKEIRFMSAAELQILLDEYGNPILTIDEAKRMISEYQDRGFEATNRG